MFDFRPIAMMFLIAVCGVLGCGQPQAPVPKATTLHEAAMFYPDQIPTLIADGADVDELDRDGNSALWMAARLSKPDSVRLLLAAGADPNVRGRRGWTPLHCTTFCWSNARDTQIAQQLIDAGADVNDAGAEYGETPLHYAVRVAESPELVQMLLDAGADIDAQSDPGRDTPLQFAVARRNHDMIALLLKAGASPTIVNDVGFVPQQQAQGDEQIALLFEKYASQ